MTNKNIFVIGILLIIAGVVALVYQGFGYTKNERVLDVGPIHADAEKHHFVWVPPVVGVVVLVGGIACLVYAGSHRTT